MFKAVQILSGLAALTGMLATPSVASAVVEPAPSAISVTRSGLSLATVFDSEGQITCGADCSGSYAPSCSVVNDKGVCLAWEPGATTLSTTPPSGFGVIWSGAACAAEASNTTSECTVGGSASVDAHFDDLTAPAVSLTSPAAGFARGTINLTAGAQDPQTGVAGVAFRVGGVGIGGADVSAPYGVSYDTTTRSDGPVAVTAQATNQDGDASSDSRTITIDNTAPAIDVVSGPDNQTYAPHESQLWTFTASDVTSGVAAIECSVVPTGTDASFGACTSGTSHAVSGLPQGAYTFAIRVRDNGGLSTTQTRAFTVDATPPETTVISGPADGSSSAATSATFGFEASEAGSAFECRVYPAALTPPAFGSCTAAAEHTASGFSPGTYSFEVRARDPYGNVDASPAKRTFTVTEADTGTGAGTGTGTGTSTSPGDGATSTPTGGTTTTTTVAPFDPRITSGFDYKGARTTFNALVITNLPKGAKVSAACAGKGCRFKSRAIPTSGAKLNVLKKLKPLRLRARALLTLRVTGPAGQLKVATWKIRKGKRPVITYRCAAPGAKLKACA